jgi:hypothetical protein
VCVCVCVCVYVCVCVCVYARARACACVHDLTLEAMKKSTKEQSPRTCNVDHARPFSGLKLSRSLDDGGRVTVDVESGVKNVREQAHIDLPAIVQVKQPERT